MNSVVCNAGPLIALAGIGQIGLLHELFGEVLVSGEVRGRGYWLSDRIVAEILRQAGE